MPEHSFKPVIRKRIALCVALLSILWNLPGCQHQDETNSGLTAHQADNGADIKAIRRFLESAGDAVKSGDVEAEVNRFTEDGIYMWPGAPSIQGEEALRSWFERRFDEVSVELENSYDEIVVMGEWAFDRGTYIARITAKSAGETREVHGKFIDILRRQDDGTWKIARRIRNLDHPPVQ